MHLLHSVALYALALDRLCAASPTASKYVLHEERSQWMPAPASLQARSRLDVDHLLPVRIALTQRGLDTGDDWLMDVAHPESPNYGKHWSAAQINTAFAPTKATVQAVRNWLISAGIEEDRISVSDNKGWLAFNANVEEAERLFQAQYYEHKHSDEDKYTIGCDAYHLPEHISEHIDYITPGVKHQLYKRQGPTAKNRLSKRKQRRPVHSILEAPSQINVAIDAKTIPINCSNYVINSDCIRSMYGVPDMNVDKKISGVNALGIFEQQAQTFSQADLQLFFANYEPQIPNDTLPYITSVDGGVSESSESEDGGESMLDLSIAYSLMYPQKINYIDVDDTYYQDNYYYDGFGDTLLDALDGSFCTYSAFGQKGNNNSVDPVYPDPHEGGYTGPLECGTYTPPKVISFSYGPGENIWPVNYERRQCNEWMKLALQGTTAVFASGDDGVAGQISSVEEDRACLGAGQIFAPGFPASCPYVLTVGATMIRPNVSGLAANPEMAVFDNYNGTNNYTSGSGFSNVFKRPTYQDDAVNGYFKISNNSLPYYSTTLAKNIGANGGLFNRNGRAVPDVSANGAWWHDYTHGKLGRSGGTSMSTPLFASLINLINEARLKAGKSTVGFLHPTLYAHPEAFHDITIGHNDGCGLDIAFECSEGWDPVTGLGTPRFGKLLEIFMSLP